MNCYEAVQTQTEQEKIDSGAFNERENHHKTQCDLNNEKKNTVWVDFANDVGSNAIFFVPSAELTMDRGEQAVNYSWLAELIKY